MARIVLGVGTSHGAQTHISAQQWPLWGAKDEEDPRFDFQALTHQAPADILDQITPEKMEANYAACLRAQEILGEVITEVAPDILVIVGDDQHEQFLDDNMPMFCIYRGTAALPRKVASGGNATPEVLAARAADAAKKKGRDSYEPAPELAEHLIQCLLDDDFDIAVSDQIKPEVGLGHAFANICRNIPCVGNYPMLPVMVNTFFPPNQPSSRRAYAFGQAIGRGIQAWDSEKRVAVVASGGLSHQVLDEELDRELLAALQSKDAETLCAIPREKLQIGTSESLNWIVAGGALGDMEMSLVDYIPAYRSRAGTGTGLAFAVWR